jgi:hypothetical protein
MHDPYSPQVTKEPKQRGCFFYGCITLIVLLVLTLIAGYLAYRAIYSWAEKYTATSPEVFPPVEMAPEDRDALDKRVKEFTDALAAEKPVEPLVLTSDELNALIAEKPDINGRVHVKIQDNKLTGQISVPLDAFGLRGRFLNGSADFNVSLDNGVLFVTADNVTVKGKPLPDSLMQGFRTQNLAKDVYNNPENAEVLRKIEKVEVKDGKITIKARPKETTDSATKKEGEQEDKAKAESPDAEKEETTPAPKASADDKEPAPAEPKAPDAEKKEETAPAPKAAEQEAHALWQGGFTAGLMLTSV